MFVKMMCDMVVQDMVVQVQACLPNVIFLLHDSHDYVNVKMAHKNCEVNKHTQDCFCANQPR